MNIDDLESRIDKLRSKLLKLIDEKEDLLDYEILNTSRQLDKIIVAYDKAVIKVKSEKP